MAPSVCPHCSRVFSSGKALGGHMSIHTVPSKCEVCEKMLPSYAALRGHMSIHRRNLASSAESGNYDASTSHDAISLGLSQPLDAPAPLRMQIFFTTGYNQTITDYFQLSSASTSENDLSLAVPRPDDVLTPFQVSSILDYNQRITEYLQFSSAWKFQDAGSVAVSLPPHVPANLEMQRSFTRGYNQRTIDFWQRSYAADMEAAVTQRAQNTGNSASDAELPGISRAQQRPTIPDLNLPPPPSEEDLKHFI